jgi:hypothetical protein
MSVSESVVSTTMSERTKFTKADVKRAVSSVEAADFQIDCVEIEPDRTIRIVVDEGRSHRPREWKGLE